MAYQHAETSKKIPLSHVKKTGPVEAGGHLPTQYFGKTNDWSTLFLTIVITQGLLELDGRNCQKYLHQT